MSEQLKAFVKQAKELWKYQPLRDIFEEIVAHADYLALSAEDKAGFALHVACMRKN